MGELRDVQRRAADLRRAGARRRGRASPPRHAGPGRRQHRQPRDRDAGRGGPTGRRADGDRSRGRHADRRRQARPTDIDSVHAGLPAEVRLTAFKAWSTPTLRGEVAYVSADASSEEQTGRTLLRPPRRGRSRGAGAAARRLALPGMPVQAIGRHRASGRCSSTSSSPSSTAARGPSASNDGLGSAIAGRCSTAWSVLTGSANPSARARSAAVPHSLRGIVRRQIRERPVSAAPLGLRARASGRRTGARQRFAVAGSGRPAGFICAAGLGLRAQVRRSKARSAALAGRDSSVPISRGSRGV